MTLTIPALSLTQPWASLVAWGEKRIETRGWRRAVAYRGALAIHAAKGYERWCADLLGEPDFAAALRPRGVRTMADLPKGAVVAVGRLAGCEWTTGPDGRPSPRIPPVTSPEYAFGDYSAGRLMLFLEDVVALPEPVQAAGMLGLWGWHPPAGLLEGLGVGERERAGVPS